MQTLTAQVTVATDGSPFARLVSVSPQIATTSARYRAGLGLVTVDSIILATFLESGCELAPTTGSDFIIVNDRNILAVEILQG